MTFVTSLFFPGSCFFFYLVLEKNIETITTTSTTITIISSSVTIITITNALPLSLLPQTIPRLTPKDYSTHYSTAPTQQHHTSSTLQRGNFDTTYSYILSSHHYFTSLPHHRSPIHWQPPILPASPTSPSQQQQQQRKRSPKQQHIQ